MCRCRSLTRADAALRHRTRGASPRARHRAEGQPARRRPQPDEPSGAVLRRAAAPGGAAAGQPAHAAGVLLPAVVGIARLPGNRPLHQRAKQIVVERDRAADRQFRSRAVEAVLARARFARLAGSVPPVGRVQLPRRRARSTASDARLPLGGRFPVIRSGASAARPAVPGALHGSSAPAQPVNQGQCDAIRGNRGAAQHSPAAQRLRAAVTDGRCGRPRCAVCGRGAAGPARAP
jgi:hypothetical protein